MCDTARVILERLGDPNVWPFVHVIPVFIYHVALFKAKGGMTHVEQFFPWMPLVHLLNTLPPPSGVDCKHESEKFSGPSEDGLPLPEDFAMRGLIWANKYHLDMWLANAKVDDEEKWFELPSMAGQRRGRILWLGHFIAESGRWIQYGAGSCAFTVAPEFADLEPDPGGSTRTWSRQRLIRLWAQREESIRQILRFILSMRNSASQVVIELLFAPSYVHMLCCPQDSLGHRLLAHRPTWGKTPST